MISCKCLNGKQGKCRLGLSAIDQTIEMLTDKTQHHLHDRLIKNLGTPKWERDLQKLDPLLNTESLSRPSEVLGWRLKETKQGFSFRTQYRPTTRQHHTIKESSTVTHSV